MTLSGRDKDIDSILKRFEGASEVSSGEIGEVHKDETYKLIAFMEHCDMIKKINPAGDNYILSKFGADVLRTGGWKKYLEAQSRKDILEDVLIRTSIQSNSLQKWLLILTTVFSLSTLVVARMDYSVHKKELKVQEEMFHLQQQSVEATQDGMQKAKSDSISRVP